MNPRNLLIITALAGTLLWSCSKNAEFPVDKAPQMIRIAAPILVNADSTVLILADYLQRPTAIDSLVHDPALAVTISPDSLQLVIKPLTRDFPKLSALTFWSGGFASSLLLEKSTRQSFRFTFDPGDKKYKRVAMKGQMNEWNPLAGGLFLKDGKWHIDLHLFPGKYQYLLLLDGKQRPDPMNPDSVWNGSNGYNSLMTVGNLSREDYPELFTRKAEGSTLEIGFRNQVDTFFVFWENYRLDHTFWKKDTSGLTIRIPGNAGSFDRSFIRVWACNRQGISNEVLVPLQDGKVLTDPAKLTRSDREAMIMYFMMVDRFNNGDTLNDQPVNDPDIDPKVNYMGGDLAGIIKKIDDGYFTSLGINTLWISPVTQNPLLGFNEYPAPHRKFSGYHGYWPITLTTVDHRFGTTAEMKKLVGEAHDQGLNVVLDFVSHHVHQDYPVLKAHPDWITQVDLPGKRKNIRIWDEHRLTTWFDIFLPTFDLTKPEVAEMVSDSALFWVTTYGIDGFRHDAAKHVPENYWRMLTAKINNKVVKEEGRQVYQIGETFGSRELVGSYINPGMLDAQFEFNLYWDIKNAFAQDNTSFRDLSYSLQQTFNYYGEHHLMGNITGNQDMPRFISYAGGALKFGENDGEAGWKRDIQVEDTIGYYRLASLQAFNMTIPGIPVIYYGDEFGLPGAGDPDNRRMMKFDSLTSQERMVKDLTARLAKLRTGNMALTYGDFRFLKVTSKQMVFMRRYFDKMVVVVFNKDKTAKEVDVEIPGLSGEVTLTSFNSNPLNVKDGNVKVPVKGNSFDILSN